MLRKVQDNKYMDTSVLDRITIISYHQNKSAYYKRKPMKFLLTTRRFREVIGTVAQKGHTCKLKTLLQIKNFTCKLKMLLQIKKSTCKLKIVLPIENYGGPEGSHMQIKNLAAN